MTRLASAMIADWARHVWLVPALPLLASAAITSVGQTRRRLVAGLAIGSVAAAALIAGGALAHVAGGGRAAVSFPWVAPGGRPFAIALLLDPLAAVMLALVSAVSLAVLVYAARYMWDEPRFRRFFSVLSLFVGAMLLLVLADDLLLLFLAWETVGLCSYLLIGHWFDRPGVPRAATQALLVTRIGDSALLAGFLLLAREVQSGSVQAVLHATTTGGFTPSVAAAAAALVLIGAMGKSAQVPLHGWLPDAMLGPTPVSALIHSATMVAAGVYLVARFFPLFVAGGMLPAVAWVGAVTTLVGAAAAFGQQDLKRLLAYSTISQLGFMFVGLGAGSVPAAILLLVGQGLFKAMLFLAAGSVGHAAGSTEFRHLGGLVRRMPVTFAVFVLGAAALAGLPVTLAWPVKDPILAAAWRASPVLAAAAFIAALLTALYSVRAVALTFLGAPRSEAARSARESHRWLVAPMIALALLLLIGAAVGSPFAGEPLEHLLGAQIPEVAGATILALAVAAAGVLLGGLAHRAWRGAVIWPPLAALAPVLEQGLGFPALYGTVAAGLLGAARLIRAAEQAVFDPLGARAAAGAMHAMRLVGSLDQRVLDWLGAPVAVGARASASYAAKLDRNVFDALAGALVRGALTVVRASRRVDMRGIDAGFDAGARSLGRIGERLRSLQTGRVYNYFTAVFAWSIGVLAIAVAVFVTNSAR